MNRNRYWNSNMGIRNRGGFNRGGRGGNRGWQWNRGGFNGPNFSYDGFPGGYRFPPPNASNYWKKRQQKREKKSTPGKRLSEDLIGVTEYISEHEGFNGIIKSRYSDFQVSEMNEKGEFAKLTTTKPPSPTIEAVDEDEDLLINKYNLEILPMETWDKINSLTLNMGKETGDNDNVEIDMAGVTKEQRTKIHDAVKKAFGDSIVGSTVNVGDKKFMRFQKYRKGVRIDNRVKWIWPGEYVYFVVYKQNCDTMDAAVRIAEKLGLHVKPSSIGYAGTKDRRAKTSQWFSVKRIDPSRIANACKHLKDIHVGNYSFANCNLKLGMLKGNKFRIALRNVTADEETVDEACQYLREKGFINYYGLQRFGSRIDTPTYDIGLKMLQGNYREAIELILEPRDGPLEHALRTYKMSGPVAALAQMPWRTPPSTHSEARLIKSLAEAPNDLIGALSKLARNIRLLYLHSYQSLVWNRAVSERIRRFGLNPVVGDCVPLSNCEIEATVLDDSESEHDDEEDAKDGDDDVTTDGDEGVKSGTEEELKHEDAEVKEEGDNVPMGEGREETTGEGAKEQVKDDGNQESKVAENEGVKNKKSKPNQNTKNRKGNKKAKKKKKDAPKPPVPIKILTQEDIDGGKYTLFNVVMPLPGAFVVYPPNMVDFYEEILTKDGLKMDMKQKVKSYNMAGAYRHIVVRPLGMEWRHVRYSDPFADLIMSDHDEMENRQVTGIIEDGKYRALLLTMTLPSSCYATMALRELLKVDTSSDNQALQNNYHKKKDKKSLSESGEKSEDDQVKTEKKVNADTSGRKDEEIQSGVQGDESEGMETKNEPGVDVDNESGEKRKLDEDVEDSVKKAKTE